MLTLDLKPLFAARGIEKPYSFLVKNGFTHNKAQGLLSGNVKVMNISYMEKLCNLLWCTPNDLFYWQPQQNIAVTEDHPLFPLTKRPAAKMNLSSVLKRVPLHKLEELSATLTKEIEETKDQ
jgi:DNA-binding Xre family transcriptional regulator